MDNYSNRPFASLKLSYLNPIDLGKLGLCLSKFSEEYQSFCKKEGVSHEEQKVLYIDKIREGSIEIFLQTAPLLLEHSSFLFEFGRHIKNYLGYFLEDNEKPKDLNKKTCQNIKEMMDVVASNPNSNISINFHGDVSDSEININIGNQQANAIQNKVNKELENLKSFDDLQLEEAVMRWHQVQDGEGTVEGKSGDKAIIEAITNKPITTYFPKNVSQIKEKMTSQANNPFQKAYIVDVTVKKLNGKPIAYRITNFHQEVDLDD